MGKSTTFKNAILNYIFLDTNLPWEAACTSIYVSLHTGDPAAGDQTTSEANYTGYARVAVVRSTSGWMVNAGAVDNTIVITFGECTAGTNTITYVGLGSTVSGVGSLIYSGTVTQLIVSSGITPTFAFGVLDLTES